MYRVKHLRLIPNTNHLSFWFDFITQFFYIFINFLNEPLGASSSAKSSTLPLPHRLNVDHTYIPKDRERDGYYR